ncbi:LAMI_0G00760g1_1 [Lachancea mirantina]|uniref:LAMI_0G00760g1_1 n=1 Tax=Lachancea mirantina TaxID=1230905 RepID=A0A1G4K777_9SACH|nr:LAMI_0G00760g1_1 [Lachancea mirantina]
MATGKRVRQNKRRDSKSLGKNLVRGVPGAEDGSRALQSFEGALGESYAICGRIAWTMGLNKAAIEHFRRAVEKLPGDVTVLIALARAVGQEGGNEQSALNVLLESPLARQEALDYRIWLQMAESYYKLQRADEALYANAKAIETLEAQKRTDAQAAILQSRIMLLKSDENPELLLRELAPIFVRAVEIARACNEPESELKARLLLAQLYKRFARYPESRSESYACLSIMNSILGSLPIELGIKRMAYLYSFLAAVEFQMGNKEQALAVCHSALQSLPRSAHASLLFCTTADLLLALGDKDKLRAFLPQLLNEKDFTTNKSSSFVYLFHWKIGRFYDALNDLNSSFAFYQSAMNLRPKSAALWIAIGCLYLKMRQLYDAEIAFSQALSCCNKGTFYPQFLNRYYRIFAAYSWLGLSQVHVSASRYQSAANAVSQCQALLFKENDMVHVAKVKDLCQAMASNVGPVRESLSPNLPMDISLDLILQYDDMFFTSEPRQPNPSTEEANYSTVEKNTPSFSYVKSYPNVHVLAAVPKTTPLQQPPAIGQMKFHPYESPRGYAPVMMPMVPQMYNGNGTPYFVSQGPQPMSHFPLYQVRRDTLSR